MEGRAWPTRYWTCSVATPCERRSVTTMARKLWGVMMSGVIRASSTVLGLVLPLVLPVVPAAVIKRERMRL